MGLRVLLWHLRFRLHHARDVSSGHGARAGCRSTGVRPDMATLRPRCSAFGGRRSALATFVATPRGMGGGASHHGARDRCCSGVAIDTGLGGVGRARGRYLHGGHHGRPAACPRTGAAESNSVARANDSGVRQRTDCRAASGALASEPDVPVVTTRSGGAISRPQFCLHSPRPGWRTDLPRPSSKSDRDVLGKRLQRPVLAGSCGLGVTPGQRQVGAQPQHRDA